MFTGYLFNPAYLINRIGGQTVARLQKQPAFFEGKFQLTQQGPMNQVEEARAHRLPARPDDVITLQ